MESYCNTGRRPIKELIDAGYVFPQNDIGLVRNGFRRWPDQKVYAKVYQSRVQTVDLMFRAHLMKLVSYLSAEQTALIAIENLKKPETDASHAIRVSY